MAFTALGAMVGFLVHAILEIVYVGFLITDYQNFGLGLTLDAWFDIHNSVAIVLVILGAYGGFRQGQHWWKILYIDKKYKRWFKKPLKQNF